MTNDVVLVRCPVCGRPYTAVRLDDGKYRVQGGRYECMNCGSADLAELSWDSRRPNDPVDA